MARELAPLLDAAGSSFLEGAGGEGSFAGGDFFLADLGLSGAVAGGWLSEKRRSLKD